MEWVTLIGSVFLGFVFVLVFLQRQRRKFKGHVVQLSPKRPTAFSRSEVAQHNTIEDLWVILQLKDSFEVFDLTEYVDEHPGGAAIANHAGGDATKGFHGPQHPPRAYEMIEMYKIGDLVD